MPKIFEYLGIIFRFYSNEHEPIHIHAIYKEFQVIVKIYLKNNMVSRVTYHPVGKQFPPAKMNDLKDFVHAKKSELAICWIKYFIGKDKIKFEKITKKIK